MNNDHVWFLDKSLLQLISLATSCFTKAIEIISLHVASHIAHSYWTYVHKKKFPFMLELWFFISWYSTFPGRVFLVKASYSTLNPSEVTLQNYPSLFTLISESIFRYVTSNITQVFGIRIYAILPNISFFWYLGVIQQCCFFFLLKSLMLVSFRFITSLQSN